ncbi:MAG TPA: hypothetical protein VHX36_09800 [Candidatus Acidoferrales bacterium]|jgi:hypothetical protein|nr:hypothetical protein [Candidatus Acidoferrales bacterium]
MDPTYEIFRDDSRGPLWIESVVGLAGVTDRLVAICRQTPASYFAFDTRESRIVAKISVESCPLVSVRHQKTKPASGAA